VTGAAVRARIDAAVESGAREVWLTGGEPTMRRDIAELVAHARQRGAERVVLETNATLVDAARARDLAQAGLGLARVNVPAFDEVAADAMTRDPGGFTRARVGMRALADAGVAIETTATLVRSTAPHLPALPAHLHEALGRALRAVVVVFPVQAADARELLSFEEAAAAVTALERDARPLGVPLRMSPADPLPPCAFTPRDRARVAHLYALTPGAKARAAPATHTRIEACARCNLRDRCAGVPDGYVARFGAPSAHPVVDDRTRRRLALVSSVDEQIERELVSYSVGPVRDGVPHPDHTVRILFRCNQACTFCFVSTHLPAPPREAVERAIREAGARGARIVLSGGEPTLDPELARWVRLARSVTTDDVVLQTNAIRLDDAALVVELEAAGLDEAFVSLHGATAEIADAVTEAPGTFARTIVGIDHLHRSRIRVIVNFVVCEKNRHELPALVRTMAARWPRASLNVSFVAPSSDVVPRDRALVPRYSDALPAIAKAVAEGRRLGVRVHGFESMCGLPLCLVPPGAEGLAFAELPEGLDGGEFVKTDTCRACRHEKNCWGLRRGYAEMHGTGELRAVT
jgi:MoaA/NifB/PqqE/SkfB family radical SAM enzyme